jgi:hypothetical protein
MEKVQKNSVNSVLHISHPTVKHNNVLKLINSNLGVRVKVGLADGYRGDVSLASSQGIKRDLKAIIHRILKISKVPHAVDHG